MQTLKTFDLDAMEHELAMWTNCQFTFRLTMDTHKLHIQMLHNQSTRGLIDCKSINIELLEMFDLEAAFKMIWNMFFSKVQFKQLSRRGRAFYAQFKAYNAAGYRVEFPFWVPDSQFIEIEGQQYVTQSHCEAMNAQYWSEVKKYQGGNPTDVLYFSI